MDLVSRLDEIIELNNRKLKELRNVPFEDTKRIGRYNYALDLEQSLYYKLKEKDKINKKYDLEISELYQNLNNELKNGNKLVNPFLRRENETTCQN